MNTLIAAGFFGTTIALASPIDGAESSNWAAFQNGGRACSGDVAIPLEWTSDDGVAWSAPIEGYGQSTPLVWGDRVYVTFCSGDMKDEYHVRAVKLSSGETLWEHLLKNSTPKENNSYVSRAAPTPVVDSAGIIAFFEGGNVVALDHRGEVRWERDLVEEYGDVEARHGLAASLEQSGEHVFIWVERSEDPYVVCASKETGETVWRAAGAGGTSWSSPRLVDVGEGRHLVLSASGKIVGLDPTTGEHLWALEDVANNSSSTPVPVANGRFLIGASEGRGPSAGKGPKSNGLVAITRGEDGSFTAGFTWRARRAMSSFASPAVAGGNAYFVNGTGVVFCIDVETGEQHYSERTAESIWATPIAVGDRVYLFGKEGTTTVIGAGDEFQVLAENPLWENAEPEPEPEESEGGGPPRGNFGGPVLYAASIAGDRLLIRRGDHLYCIGASSRGGDAGH